MEQVSAQTGVSFTFSPSDQGGQGRCHLGWFLNTALPGRSAATALSGSSSSRTLTSLVEGESFTVWLTHEDDISYLLLEMIGSALPARDFHVVDIWKLLRHEVVKSSW